MNIRYINKDKVVYVDSDNRFIYEVLIYIMFENIVSLSNSAIFVAEEELEIIESISINENAEMYTSLSAAPKQWLIDNDYVFYV